MVVLARLRYALGARALTLRLVAVPVCCHALRVAPCPSRTASGDAALVAAAAAWPEGESTKKPARETSAPRARKRLGTVGNHERAQKRAKPTDNLKRNTLGTCTGVVLRLPNKTLLPQQSQWAPRALPTMHVLCTTWQYAAKRSTIYTTGA